MRVAPYLARSRSDMVLKLQSWFIILSEAIRGDRSPLSYRERMSKQNAAIGAQKETGTRFYADLVASVSNAYPMQVDSWFSQDCWMGPAPPVLDT